jgi:hypothetical protein
MALLEFLSRRKNPEQLAPANELAICRRIRAALTEEQRESEARGARITERIRAAREREVRVREEHEAATAERLSLESESLAGSSASEHRMAGWRRQLSEGAPAEIHELRHNINVVMEHARRKFDTRIARGYQDADGRRGELVSSNVDQIGVLLAEARRLDAELAAELLAEVPDTARFAPFGVVSVPANRLQRGGKSDGQASKRRSEHDRTSRVRGAAVGERDGPEAWPVRPVDPISARGVSTARPWGGVSVHLLAALNEYRIGG